MCVFLNWYSLHFGKQRFLCMVYWRNLEIQDGGSKVATMWNLDVLPNLLPRVFSAKGNALGTGPISGCRVRSDYPGKNDPPG